MEVNNYEIVAQKELGKAEGILAQARSQQIETANDAGTANELVKIIKAKAKEIETTRVNFVKPLNNHVAMINGWFNKPLAVLASAEKTLKDGIRAYDIMQQQIAAEAQAKLRAQAAKEEEAKRAKLEVRADKAEASGKDEKAEELREQAAAVHVDVPVIAAPKPTMSYRTDYDFEVVDKATIPEQYKLVDEVTIRRIVKAEKESCKIPGIRVVTKQTSISR
jgi:hypothetical protein